MIGTQISQYRLIDKLGEGGMGVVYKAMDTLLDRTVAIKLISSDRTASAEVLQRFTSEAKVQATLSHPNITTLYSYLVWEGRAVMVMEYVEGETLQQMIVRRGPIPADVAVPLFKQALAGVGAAHRRGIVHRDIKPANIMVSTDGVVKVMDFGIAKVLGVAGTTRTNLQMGTVWYMAPEQVLAKPVDARTDIYSLGVTLYELLSGQVPFRADSEYEILSSHVQRVPELPTLHYPHIPGPCVNAVMRALAKEPDQRYASTDDFSAALDLSDCDPNATSTAPVSSFKPVLSDPGGKTVLQTVPSPMPLPATVFVPPPVAKKSGPGLALILTIVAVLIAGAAGLFFYAEHDRAEREAAGGNTRTRQRGSSGADEEKRREAEQAQAEQEMQQQLADARAHGGSGSGSSTAAPPKQTPQPPAHPTTPAPAKPTPPPVPPSQPASPDLGTRLTMLSGTWSGSYICAQGTTGATLQIVASSAQSVGGLLQFAVPNGVPGSYFMRGALDPSTNHLTMNFTKWKNQPPGYSPGNISGTVNFSTYEIRGNVVLPGCAGFSVHKQQ
jgi:type II secretory pathway pseudopilin PulG/predicted Ser/Thr protein kinase